MTWLTSRDYHYEGLSRNVSLDDLRDVAAELGSMVREIGREARAQG